MYLIYKTGLVPVLFFYGELGGCKKRMVKHNLATTAELYLYNEL